MTQVFDEARAPLSKPKILIGGPNIAEHITGKRDRETVRWLYSQLDKLPIWQLEANGALYAYPDELEAFFAEKADEAKAARNAAREAKLAKKDVNAKAAAQATSAEPRQLPRRGRPRKPRREAEKAAAIV
jgi:hypothetical protein